MTHGLVTRLRDWAKAKREQEPKIRGYDGATAGLCEEAANEIERIIGMDNRLLIERNQRIAKLEDVLSECVLQIEYLHEKFQETGSGNAVLARARDVLEAGRRLSEGETP